MFCQKCGTRNFDGSAQCTNCGFNLKLITSKEKPEAKDLPIGFLSWKKRMLAVAGLLLLVAVFLSIHLFFVSKPAFEGKYYNFFNSNSYLELTFEENNVSGVFFLSKDKDTEESRTGSFTVINNKIVASQPDGTVTEYTSYQNYLVNEKETYLGKIPEGISFESSCTNGSATYIFHSDGTVIFIPEENYPVTGSYKRDGDVITLRFNNGQRELKLLIFNGGVNSSVYKK